VITIVGVSSKANNHPFLFRNPYIGTLNNNMEKLYNSNTL